MMLRRGFFGALAGLVAGLWGGRSSFAEWRTEPYGNSVGKSRPERDTRACVFYGDYDRRWSRACNWQDGRKPKWDDDVIILHERGVIYDKDAHWQNSGRLHIYAPNLLAGEAAVVLPNLSFNLHPNAGGKVSRY